MIIFYSMGKNCGFCISAENMLNKNIKNGEIILVEASNAPQNKFQGFPAFENTNNGKTYVGLPKNKDDLYSKLDVYNNKMGVL